MNIKRLFVLSLLILSFETNSKCQNLILNPDLEDTLCCPHFPGMVSCTNYWFDPNGTSDFYNECDPTYIPSYITPQNGLGFGGLFIYFLNTDGSEYLEATLQSKLIGAHEYCLNFYIKPENVSLVADGIGVYFSETQIDTGLWLLDYLTPQIQNPPGNFYKDTLNWTLFTGRFIANGNEQFMVIGNFKKADSTMWDTLRNEMYDVRAYIYVDNFSLVDCTDTTAVNTFSGDSNDFSIYPNPVSDYIFIESKIQNANFILTDVTGRLLMQFNATGSRTQISVAHLPNGVYFVTNNRFCRKILVNR